MSRWVRAAAGGLAVLVALSAMIDPSMAAGKKFFNPFQPPPGMQFGNGHHSNGLTYQTSTGKKYKINPVFLRQVVRYETVEKAGTLVVDTGHKFLFLVMGNGQAMRYGIGTAKDGFEWSGTHHISAKREWPDWTPPSEMLKRRPELPHHMEGGPNNPLGARALYLGSTLYRIHGTNEPWTIGGNVSSGCIRMVNDDVIDLYQRVKVGAKVIVM
jgi:lipoprotein-anchoring transpeptidase ErfK/SrfK